MRDFTKKYFHLNSSAVYNSSAKKTEIIETNDSKLQEQTENVNKSEENTSKNIAEISKQTTLSSESIQNIRQQENDDTSRNKIKFETNNISNKIQNNIQTTTDHIYIANFKKLKENVIEQIERQNNTNVNHIQTTNITNHSTLENNNIKTTYHNLQKRKLQNEQKWIILQVKQEVQGLYAELFSFFCVF